MGPLTSKGHRDRVKTYIRSGVEQGASLLLGDHYPDTAPINKGFFVMPTVFADVDQDMKIALRREPIDGLRLRARFFPPEFHY